MRIGIISDTHGDVKAWQKAIKAFGQVDLVLHAGDILYHGPRNIIPEGYNPRSLAESINSFPSPVLIAKGNCDAEVDQLLINTPLAQPYLFAVLNGKRVLVHHGHFLLGEKLEELVIKWRIDLCISGHTHLAASTKIEGCAFFNPGSCALPKDGGSPSVGLWEGNTLKLIDLNSLTVLSSLNI